MLGLSFLICQVDVLEACMSHHYQEEDNSSQAFFPIHPILQQHETLWGWHCYSHFAEEEAKV